MCIREAARKGPWGGVGGVDSLSPGFRYIAPDSGFMVLRFCSLAGFRLGGGELPGLPQRPLRFCRACLSMERPAYQKKS